MRAITRIIAFGGIVTAVLGCSKPFNYNGHWIGDRGLAAKPGEDPVLYHTLSKLEVTIKDNARFDVLNMSLPMSGNVEFSGDTANLKVDTVLGRALKDQLNSVQDRWSKPLTLEPQKDGSIVFKNPNTPSEPSVVLKREPKP